MDQVRKPLIHSRVKRSWVEISLSRLRNNLSRICDRISPECEIVAVVKADAYGHGAPGVSKALRTNGVNRFAVADMEEALEVRAVLPEVEIIVLGGCDPGCEEIFQKAELRPSLYDVDSLKPGLKYHLKIDTGMGRLGVPWEKARKVILNDGDQIVGVYSSFASSDTDLELTRVQFNRFEEATKGLGLFRHLSNSAALRVPSVQLDAVRPGLALYGVDITGELPKLQPILTWKARLLTVNSVLAGYPVGYGGTFRANRPSRIGVLPFGYADGFSRRWSNRGKVKTDSGFAPVVGAVSMDLVTVDLTDLPQVQAGDEVTVLENENDSPISAMSLARDLETIPYEILTSIGERVSRVYVE